MKLRTACLVLGALLSACAAANPADLSSTAAPASALPARISLAALIADHPFAETLARYDAALVDLRAAHNLAPSRSLDARLASNVAAVAVESSTALSRLSRLEIGSPAEPLPKSIGNPDAARDAIARFDEALRTRFLRAHAYRAQRLREQESDVAMTFARAHLHQRLQLRLRLKNHLYLTEQTRAQLQSDLAALDARERATLDRQRDHNEIVLRDYDTELRARGAAQRAALVAGIAAHDRAVESLQATVSAPIPQRLIAPPNRSAATAAAFGSAAIGLSRRFAELRGINESARNDSQQAIDAFAAQRNRLFGQIVVSIENAADDVARSKGLGRVYTAAGAPKNAVDITAEVRKRLLGKEAESRI
jgi:hypothetical protein